jgi:hypothetical protein
MFKGKETPQLELERIKEELIKWKIVCKNETEAGRAESSVFVERYEVKPREKRIKVLESQVGKFKTYKPLDVSNRG